MEQQKLNRYIVTHKGFDWPYIAFEDENDAKIWAEENGGTISQAFLTRDEFEMFTGHPITEEEFLELLNGNNIF